MTTDTDDLTHAVPATIAEALRVIDTAHLRADRRQVGELVRYPAIDIDRYIDATGIIESIECITPDLPYHDRTLEFRVRDTVTGRLNPIRVSVAYLGLTPRVLEAS